MKAAIPFHKRSSNTSVPPETWTEEEKITGPGGMIPTYPPEMVAMRGCLTRMTKMMSQPFISRGGGGGGGGAGEGTILGAVVPGHPTRAQPHEGGCKRSSPSLHGCSGTTNGIPVHGRSTTFPSPNKVQNVAD